MRHRVAALVVMVRKNHIDERCFNSWSPQGCIKIAIQFLKIPLVYLQQLL